MQNRQQIRNQLGILEEKLEELGALACANERSSLEPDYSPDFRTEILLQDAYHSMDELNRLVHDQQLFRSVPAAQFLQKISSILVTHASAENVDIAISHMSIHNHSTLWSYRFNKCKPFFNEFGDTR